MCVSCPDDDYPKFFVSPVFIDRVCFVYEVIAISESWLMLGNRDFSRGEMNEIMSFVVT